MTDPAQLPEIPRTVDATGKVTISGEQSLSGVAGLYDVAGAIRGQLVDLIAAEKARAAKPAPKKKRHLF